MNPLPQSPLMAPPQPDYTYTGPEQVDYKDRQIHYERKKRHWQRWVFYVVLSVVFLAMTAYAVYIYSENTKLVNSITEANASLKITTQNLSDSEKQSLERQRKVAELEKSLADSQADLDKQTADLQKAGEDKTKLLSSYNDFKVSLGSSDANIYSFLINYGVGVTADNLIKIPLADYNLGGLDTDGDGLSDTIEVAIGTDASKSDSDGDGFSDRDELLAGYNALGEGKLPVDAAFVDLNRGSILIQVEQNQGAWYINPKDGKRYFLGNPAKALQAIEKL